MSVASLLSSERSPNESRETSRGAPEVGGKSGSRAGRETPPRLHELNRLARRCGSGVVRLVRRPVELVTAVFGSGFETVRFRNESTVSAFQSDGISLQRRDGTFEFRTPRSAVRLDPDAWRVGFFTDVPATLAAYDHRGRPLVEFELSGRGRSAFERKIDRFTHAIQEPATFFVRDVEPESPRRPEVDREYLVERWREPAAYARIDDLVETLPIGRRRAFEELPIQWTGGVGFPSVRRLSAAAERSGLTCRFETMAPGFVSTLRTPSLRVAGRGACVLAVGARENGFVDLRRIASAYYVRKPARDGIRTAVELFDDADRLQARIRPSRDASFDERVLWRSCLPCGLVCDG